jgi:hypothetical protein
MARKFMFVCLGLLALALAYHLGASSAQSFTGEFVGISQSATGGQVLLAANGDCYRLINDSPPGSPDYWYYLGNPLSGGTGTQSSTWGQIKAQSKD